MQPIKKRRSIAQDESGHLRQAVSELEPLLADAQKQLQSVLQEEVIMAETPIEAEFAMASAAEAIETAMRRLASIVSQKKRGPTRQQGPDSGHP